MEPDKTFSVQLCNPVNTQIGARSNLTVTILDNDASGYPGFGLNGNVSSVTPGGDGEVILSGSFISINGVPRSRIGRVSADASVDESFDPGNGADNSILAAVGQPDGKIICGGTFVSYNGVMRSRLMRLNADGSLDLTFEPGAGADGNLYSLAVATNGAIFAGGSFRNFGGLSRNYLVKLNADGSVATNFVPPTSTVMLPIRSLALQADGRLIIGPTTIYGLATNICVRINADGSVDTSLSATTADNFINTYCNTIVPQQDGKILVGGSFTIIDGFALNNIARLNYDGSVDTSFNAAEGANGSVNRLLTLDSGKIMAVGAFTTYAGVPRNRIARINSDGSIDPTFDPGLGADSTISDIAPLPGGNWAVGGSFRSFNGFPRYGFAILGPDGQLVTRLRFESFALSGSIPYFGCLVEPEKAFQLQSSSNLTDWQTIYSSLIHQSFTNFSLPDASQDRQFYRLLQTR